MKVHFISIGGSVMHQLAIALKRKGYLVTGTDDEIFEPAKSNLQAQGLLPPNIGWNPDLIHEGLDAVILGMHARADNPELIKAQALGLPIYSFPEYILNESTNKTRVVVGGSHGKTTTTAMIMYVLKEAGKAFDYLVGARLEGFSQSVNISDSSLIVCEGDEYPASALERRPKFHFLYPHIAIITGIAWDHINVFPTFENYLDQFRIFIDRIESGGILIYNATDDTLKSLVEEHSRGDIRYVPYSVPNHRIHNGVTEVTIEDTVAKLKVFGDHNLLNMQAAWLACNELGISANMFSSAIASFTGAARRLEVLASKNDCTVFRDFAHAPSKVKATLAAVRQQFPDRKLYAAIELHTYSSLSAAFMPHYKGCLEGADSACVYYSPHAMEIKKMPPLPVELVKEGFEYKGLEVFTKREELEAWLHSLPMQNANLLLMSSGTYDNIDLNKVLNEILPGA